MNILMRFRRFSEASKPARLSALCILCLPSFCLAQQSRVKVSPPEQVAVKRGSIVAQTLEVAILPGFHVNSDKPKDEFLIPLKLTWNGSALETKSITYPNPEQLKVGADELVVFTGSFKIKTEFEAPRNAASGAKTVTGKLRYQACNNQMCFRPASIDISLPVVVE